jgi:hypothetical protein
MKFTDVLAAAAAQARDKVLAAIADHTRLHLPAGPIPTEWLTIIKHNVPLAAHLSPAELEHVIRLSQLLLSETPFEGCDGLEITEEIRVTIAATACLLILNLPYPRFLKLKRVVMYPETFVPVRAPTRHDREVKEANPALGEAWIDGIVVLSWESVLSCATKTGTGHNVIIHEFAHLLDGEDGAFDGIPILEGATSMTEWNARIAEEFAHQQAAVAEEQEPVLDEYAATNRAEFFAVATETFFDAPDRLREGLPELFALLSGYYRR